MDSGKADKRRRLLIKRQFQQSMMLEALLIMFILLNLVVTVCYFLIDSIADVQTLKHTLAYSIAGLELIGFFIFFTLNLRSSHRVAGPVYVLERHLKQIQDGDLTFQMRLREADQFHEVKDQFNDTLAALQDRIGTAQRLTQQLKAQGVAPELVAELDKALGYFNTQPEVEVPAAEGEPESSTDSSAEVAKT